MRSAAREAPKRRHLVRRVAMASAAAAALGGAAAALASGTAATGLLANHEDATIRAAARHIARELEDEVADQDDDDDADDIAARADPWGVRGVYRKELAEELDDLDLPGARARVDGPGGRALGEAILPRPAVGDCESATLAASPIRACTVAFAGGTITLAASAGEAQERRALLVWSTLAGLVIGALLGGLASHRAAVWALGPLGELTDRVRRVRAHDPDPEALAPPLDHVELETLRAEIAVFVERLRDALSRARGFAAQAAHELRTPLTTIVGELELLAESARPEDAEAVSAARRRADDLVTLVQRLLILAQPDPLAGSVEAVDLADVLDAARAALPEPSRARVTASVEDDVLVRGDPALLGALLTNAIDNALKFSTGQVEVQITQSAGEARIAVSDHGPGIAEGERDRVFDAFYRTAAARQSSALGHGVGLALIAHVARAHGGRAQIDSAPGEGTRLAVHLPTWTPPKRATRGALRDGPSQA